MTVGRRWLAVALVALAGSGACSTSDSGGAADEAVAGEPGPGELVDATEEYGLDAALAGIRGHAVAVADIDGDGWDDLFVGTFADREPETYGRGDEGPAPDRLLRGSADGFVVDGDFDPPLGRTAGALSSKSTGRQSSACAGGT